VDRPRDGARAERSRSTADSGPAVRLGSSRRQELSVALTTMLITFPDAPSALPGSAEGAPPPEAAPFDS